MKKFLLFVSAVLAMLPVCGQSYAELYEGDEARMLRETADSLSIAGDEDGIAAFVDARLASSGVEMLESSGMRSFGIAGEDGDTLTFRNVVGVIPGGDKTLRNRYIVVGTSLSPENPTAISLFLRLCARLSATRPLLGRSVVVAAFGGSSVAAAGSWYFLNRAFYSPSDIDAYVGLDMFGSPNAGFFAFTGSNPDMNRIVGAVSSSLQPAVPVLVSTEPAPGDHRSFYSSEIPSVLFTTREAGKQYFNITDAREYEELDRQCEYLYNFCMSLSGCDAPRFRVKADEEGEVATVPFASCDRKPRFLGSSDPRAFLSKWVYRYLRYPDDALLSGVQGRVQVGFVIDEKGKLRDVEVEKGVHPSLDAEALRVIEASPDWKPGTYDGRPVRARLSVGVDFVLKKKK